MMRLVALGLVICITGLVLTNVMRHGAAAMLPQWIMLAGIIITAAGLILGSFTNDKDKDKDKSPS